MRLLRSNSVGFGLALGLLAGPATAVGGTTIGSDLTSAGVGNANCTGGVNYVQTALPGRPLLAPSAGVITRWSVRDSGGSLGLRVVDQVSGVNYLFLRSSATETGDGFGSGTQSFPTRLGVAAGDGIAIACDGPAGIRFQGGLGMSYTYLSFFPPPPDGMGDSGGMASGNEILFNAEIEADADGDVFGDETQDKCLGTPGNANGCPSTVTIDKLKRKGDTKVTVVVTVPGPGTLKVGSASDQALATKAAKSLKAVTRDLTATTKQQLTLALKLTKSAIGSLKEAGKLKLKVKGVYTPPGGPPGSQTKKKRLTS